MRTRTNPARDITVGAYTGDVLGTSIPVSTLVVELTLIIDRQALYRVWLYITCMDDAYNASPLSVYNALQTLHDAQMTGTTVVLLGDMLELGAGTYNRPLFCSTLANFTTENTGQIPQNVLTSSQKVDECKPRVGGRDLWIHFVRYSSGHLRRVVPGPARMIPRRCWQVS